MANVYPVKILTISLLLYIYAETAVSFLITNRLPPINVESNKSD